MSHAITPELMTELIGGYSSLGAHRTGSPADEATSRWIIDWLGKQQVEARTAAFPFPKVECRAAHVEAGDSIVEGTPLYDGAATESGGIEAPLVLGGSAVAGKIVLLDQPGPDEFVSLLDPARGEGRPLGVIAATGDPDGFVMLRNAERMASRSPLPVLQIARNDAASLLRIANTDHKVRLVIDSDVVPSRATNVVADIKAPASDGLVVVLTPKSGWFSCAAERGAGVAITMALAARIAAIDERRKDVRVLFTSGHELGHCGLLNYLEQNPGLRNQAQLWVQLGASIGARYPHNIRVFSREDGWREWFMSVLARHGAGPATLAQPDVRPGGESREVFGCPFVALAGHHAYFHSPRDIPEIAVDAEGVARFGRALGELIDRAVG